MRPSSYFFLSLTMVLCLDVLLYFNHYRKREIQVTEISVMQKLVTGLGLTDLAVSTEARYTRHPAVSDPVVPYMDHPGAIEHFPSGSFFVPQTNP